MKKKPLIIHEFNLKKSAERARRSLALDFARMEGWAYQSFYFHEKLQTINKPDFSSFREFHDSTLYRVSSFSPLSLYGSLSNGGRFNLGNCQILKEFKINPFAALYLANNLQCAVDEYTHGTKLTTKDKKFSLTPVKSFELWNADRVVEYLDIPNIKNLVNQGRVLDSWAYYKVPMPSQILGNWLKEIGGDGIIFRSTQHLKARCVALFAKDDAHASSLFSEVRAI